MQLKFHDVESRKIPQVNRCDLTDAYKKAGRLLEVDALFLEQANVNVFSL